MSVRVRRAICGVSDRVMVGVTAMGGVMVGVRVRASGGSGLY